MCGVGVVPRSASRGVFVESEEVVEALLNGVHLREHPPCPRTSSLTLVEQHGLLDFAERREESTHAHVESGLFGFSHHEPGNSEGEHAVEGVHSDLLVGPVEHRGERNNLAILHLAEVGLDGALGPVGSDDVGDWPLVVVGEEDPLAEELVFEFLPGLGIDVEGEGEVRWARTLGRRTRRA